MSDHGFTIARNEILQSRSFVPRQNLQASRAPLSLPGAANTYKTRFSNDLPTKTNEPEPIPTRANRKPTANRKEPVQKHSFYPFRLQVFTCQNRVIQFGKLGLLFFPRQNFNVVAQSSELSSMSEEHIRKPQSDLK